MSRAECRCRNLADEHMPPSARIGDAEAKRRGLWSTAECDVHRPAAPAAEAGDELRDRLIAELPRHVDVIAPVAEGFEVGCRCGWTGSTYLHGWGDEEARTEYRRHKADALLAPLLQRLVAEAAEAARLRAAVQRVEAAIDRHADNLTATQRRAFHRAMDGDRG